MAEITINIFESKKSVGRLKHRNKKEAKNVMIRVGKRNIKGEKHIAQMDFAEYLRISDVSENSKAYYSRFLRYGFHEKYCYISKCR